MRRAASPASPLVRLLAACLLVLAAALPLQAWAVDTDGDGVDDSVDAFPAAAEATTDTDGDGLPDSIDYSKASLDFYDPFNGGFQPGWTADPEWTIPSTFAEAYPNTTLSFDVRLTRIVVVPPGGSALLSYDCKTTSSFHLDVLVGGVLENSCKSTVDWKPISLLLDSGIHEITFRFSGYAFEVSRKVYLDEVKIHVSSLMAADHDDDNDGVPDLSDALPLDPAESVDTDSDGTGNNADIDDDNDGVLDGADNCSLAANVDQLDTDGDGVGNVCETGPGDKDAAFNPASGANGSVYALAVHPDGKVLLGGSFTAFNGTAINRIARLNINGSLDTAFNVGVGVNNRVRALVLQLDGKMLLGGEFSSVNGVVRNRIARLDADGLLDATFNAGSSSGYYVNALLLQPDGRVLLGGTFTNSSSAIRHIARLNSDGSLDMAFNSRIDIVIGKIYEVKALALQPDGKVLLGGYFTKVNGVSRNNIVRLNADGSLDTAFNPVTGANDLVYAMALQPDGRILLGGNFTSVNGIGRNRIARLNADGSLDTSFNPGSGANLAVAAMVLQPDGKILLGGNFTSVNGVVRNRIARLDADGSLDEDFNPGWGADNTVNAMVIQPDGMAVIGGSFTSYNGVAANYITRIYTGDKDQDGIEDAGDWFDNAGAAVDSDRDGKPDAWLQPNPYGCLPTDVSCNGLTLDEDDDNDGVPDYLDPEPLNAANSSVWPLDGGYKGSLISEGVSP